jgi:hypothetical protein
MVIDGTEKYKQFVTFAKTNQIKFKKREKKYLKCFRHFNNTPLPQMQHHRQYRETPSFPHRPLS